MREPVAPASLVLTGHPLQRCGAWATAALAGREHPDAVTADDLDTVAATIVQDTARAAAAEKEAVAYDWWKVLFALYPNSKATHAGRPRDVDALRAQIAEFFAADSAPTPRPCVFCGGPSGALWTKSHLPLFDTNRAVNTLPPGSAGWPVCRACRIAMWALPYGARVTAGSATVLTCDDERVEREFVRRNVNRARRIRQVGFSGLRASTSPQYLTLAVLGDPKVPRDESVGTTLWMFKNDNQEPWLRVTSTRVAVGRFVRRLQADPQARAGWKHLCRALTRRGTDGTVTRHGTDEAARTLFDREGRHDDGLLRALLSRAERPDQVAESALLAWRALSRLYLKEMYEVDTRGLQPVVSVLADWITAETNPRGRFLEYRDAANYPNKLRQLLMKASARLYLDGHQPALIHEITPTLLGTSPDGYRWRGQLFFEVLGELVRRGVQIGKRSEAEPDEGEDTDMPFPQEDEDYA